MKSILRRRPSPALVIACLALFSSLGGVSYGVATGFIDGREIRNNSVRTFDLRNNDVRGRDIRNSTIGGRDLARNTLTGDDVNESKLGKVPSAERADAAGSADSIGGIAPQQVAFSAPTGTGFTRILDHGGLALDAECQADNDVVIRATAARGGSSLYSKVGNGLHSGMPTGAPVTVFPGNDANSDVADDLVFRGADGRTVTVDLFVTEQSNAIPGNATHDCGVFGIAHGG